MIASAVSPLDNNYHVFIVGRQRWQVHLAFQRPDGSWWGEGGSPPQRARTFRFAGAPTGTAIRGIDASIRAGMLHLFCQLDDGRTMVTWQGRDGWHGREAQGFAASFVWLAPSP